MATTLEVQIQESDDHVTVKIPKNLIQDVMSLLQVGTLNVSTKECSDSELEAYKFATTLVRIYGIEL